MKYSMIKTAAFAFIASAFTTQAMAASHMERRIVRDISNQSHQAVKTENNRYDALKSELNSKLVQLNQASEMNAFNALAAEAKELAQQTKAAALAQTFNYGEPSDNRRAELGVNYVSWKLNKLIDSLDQAAAQSDLAAAKTEIRSHI
ncbi:hypothetical protein CBG46_04285 [Actinobacillus succinogenes]|uniref:Uncharacterized protein n=1 Tax=Actinobacillus succinogenes (strain ATCC 55618 / DSM 22257 / CCUG 43843 / 130Z) TaxID=339671 RepID=A6VKU9_ACTSZ|nr:hypothetical protein [Actinobacillus succinogenes]ABR73596.1 conserved hypothetical protein [Actinobacillus succinogenes 130Z]PHI39944.1 hypothetical protein CBG46_04285 [Actinobacillus succinogenes]